ncbi:MFS transporter [Pediococcus acidilactici]|uniref:Transporter, major facilitator family protein n=1 Tax=Pediococcus acidilactici DSM 20284 TaxID=862514 RepID=E0NI79_PEDAC|nr:MFS transporter [Pediococcus acidilactici]AZP90161.1 MFS transporter [Pediococcus acidilactici]EFL94842.1 transporter, major facilitator family protein [Pediococcus acidilactici DSM 20284]KRN15779.1 MFS family major facilitator transporter [Pediococcus acidilactici]MDG9740060.1 MFS transporter [Pediococcus acidilactici]NKZ16975.1 multidrug efflux MFS transporter [Pediococcus acidilactici]
MEAQNTRHTNPMIVVAVVALMSFMGILTETSMNVTFPALMKEFHVPLNTVQWVTAGYLLMAALVMLTSAYMKRRFTNRQLFTAAAILFSSGDLICGLATNFWVLLAGRLIQAGCVGLCTPLMVNIILDVVPQHKLGTYIGMANLIILIAPALGPTFGGAVVAFNSWRMIFWSTLPVALVLMLLGMKVIKQYAPTDQHYAFDWTRFLLLGIALVSLIVGLNALGEMQLGTFVGLLIVSIGLTILFVKRSHTATKALFSLQVFKQPAFLYSFLPYIMLQFANVGINFLLPNYVQDVFQATSLVGGLILLPGSLFNGFGQPLYGWLLDRFGGKVPLYIGDILFTLALVGLMCWGPQLGVVGITIAYLIFAIGRSMAFGNSVAYGLKHIDKEFQNDANALYNTGQQVTGAIGTTVLALLMGSVKRPGYTHAQNVSAGSQLAFILLVIFGCVIFVFFHHLVNLKNLPEDKGVDL